MITQHFTKRYSSILYMSLLAILLVFSACKKDDDDDTDNPSSFTLLDASAQINVTGHTVVDVSLFMPEQSGGTAGMLGTYSDPDNILGYVLTQTGGWQLAFGSNAVNAFQTGTYALNEGSFNHAGDLLHYNQFIIGSLEITSTDQQSGIGFTYNYCSGNITMTLQDVDGNQILVTGDFENVVTGGVY